MKSHVRIVVTQVVAGTLHIHFEDDQQIQPISTPLEAAHIHLSASKEALP